MTRHGVALVVRHEFQVRLRARWRRPLAVASFVVLFLVAILCEIVSGLENLGVGPAWRGERWQGLPVFGGLMLVALALGLIVSPVLTARSINGERALDTLATVQVTRLTAADIAIGKLLAGWAVAAGVLVSALPFVGWTMLRGGVGVWRPVVVLLVAALLIGVACAVSQALSALLARGTASALLSYVVMFALGFGTILANEWSQPLVGQTRDGEARDDRVWFLLAPNPFVILADAAPREPSRRDPATGYLEPPPSDVLGGISRDLRLARLHPDERRIYHETGEFPPGAPVWPYGLGFHLLIGAGSVWITIRRLRAPVRKPSKGTRTA